MVPAAANPTPSIDLRLLGPLSATVDSTPVPIGGPRQMAVLARLMLTPDQVVTMNQLVESVWDGDEPSQPQVAIRSYVSNLRRAIEPNRRRRSTESCLASSPPGYRLAIDPMSVDWVRFERLVSDGRRCANDGQPRKAVGFLRRAIELWQGCPCSGLPESPFFVAQVARLSELKETAVESLFEALLALGDHSSVAAEVEAAIAENPLRERLTELGMLAFYRSGRQSDALALGQRLRARLVEELGVDPSRSIDSLEFRILNHDTTLDVHLSDTRLSEARLLDDRPLQERSMEDGSAAEGSLSDWSVDGGLGRVRPLDSGSVDNGSQFDRAGLAPLAMAPNVGVDRLRSKPQHLALIGSGAPIGRGTELAMLASVQVALDAGRSATAIVTGEPGIGKTHLVRSAAQQLEANDYRVAWSRSLSSAVPDETSPLWPWAQIVLALVAGNGGSLPVEMSADLAPLAALGPSVAGALELMPREVPSRQPAQVSGPASGQKPRPEQGTPRSRQAETVIDLDLLSASQEAGPTRPAVAPRGSAHQIVSPVAGGQSAVVTFGEHPTVGATSGYSRAEIMLAVTSLLERLARASPVVLIFEDLQWADEGSVSLLNYAAATLADKPVGFILTWRETDVAAGSAPPGLRELSRLSTLIRIELEGLDDAAILDLADALGRPLTIEQAASVHQRCDGNPLFVREVLTHPDMSVGSGRRWSTVIDAVTDRIERLPVPAAEALQAAALFRRSFSVASVAPLCQHGPELTQEALNRAVQGGILHEVDPTTGTYRFRHSLLAEVLASRQLAVDAAAMHQQIGRQMLRDLQWEDLSTGVDVDSVDLLGVEGYEVAYHLSKSPAAEDRLLAGQVGLGLVRRRLDMARLNEIDSYVDIALTVASRPAFAGASGDSGLFVVDAMLYESWRAWIDGNRQSWRESAEQALVRAVEELPQVKEGRTAARIMGQPQPTMPAEELERRQHRVQTAIMNMLARPILPVGPTEVGHLGLDASDTNGLLTEAVELLSSEDSAKWVAQLHSAYLHGLSRPGRSGQHKASRDAQKIVSGARKRVRSDEVGNVLRTYVARFAESIDPETRLSLVAEISTLHPSDGPALFEARFAYPALMELGRLPESRPLIDAALDRAVDEGQPFPIASARLLLIRHLLWTGAHDAAECELRTALAAWNRLGLPKPLSLVRQLAAVQASTGRPQSEKGLEAVALLPVGRISQAEHALRLSRRGDVAAAIQCLGQVLETVGAHHLSLSEQAHLAVAAAEVGHEKAAITASDMLRPYGDQPVLRSDGSIVLGPASLFAGIAAKAAGDRRAADSLLNAAACAVQRFGGSPIPVDALISDLG